MSLEGVWHLNLLGPLIRTSANCATLWPIFHPASSDEEDDRPDLIINTIGGSANISAHVVYENESGLCVMMNGPYASNQRQACESLLAMTSDILCNLWKKHVFYEDGLRAKKAGSGGTYYAK